MHAAPERPAPSAPSGAPLRLAGRRGPGPARLLLALAVLALGARASDVDAFDWEFTDCAGLEGDEVVLSTCYGGAACESSWARFPTFLPGTLTFDVRYDIEELQQFTELQVRTDSGAPYVFGNIWGGPWCEDAPCGELVTRISVPLVPYDEVEFYLACTETGCTGDNGTRVRIQDLTFVPDTGFTPLVGAVDAAALRTVDTGALTGDDQFVVSDVDGVGDIDGDGHDDWVVGDRSASTTAASAGAVRVLSGATGAVLLARDGNGAGTDLGAGVAGVGDVDGDGVPDVAAGDPYASGMAGYRGRVWVWSGADGTLLSNLGPGLPEAELGRHLDGAGDVDGDGRGDYVVSAEAEDTGAPDGGTIRVVAGKDASVLLEVHGAPGDFMGQAVAGVGDVDGDGVPDVAATSTLSSFGAPAAGLCRVWSGADGSVLLDIPGTAAGDRFGTDVEAAGDVNADGFCDVVVSGDRATVGGLDDAGVALVISGLDGSVLFSLEGTVAGQRLGLAVAGGADLDVDGFDDVLVGDVRPSVQPQLQDAGRVVALAGPDGEILFERSDLRHHSLGAVLALGPDVDADGIADVIASAFEQPDAPRALVVSGDPDDHGAPVLAGTGTLVPGTPTTLDVTGGPPAGTGVLVLGLSVLAAPFKGGLLIPSPDLVVGGLPLDGAGTVSLPFTWPAGVTAPAVGWVQVWMPSADGPRGFLATNGLMLAPP